MARPCSSDSSFGPGIDGSCRGGFDLTLLFEDSMLGLLPHAILLLLAPLRLGALLRRAKRIRTWERVGLAKLAIGILYAASSLVLLALWASTESYKSPVSIAAATVELLASIFVLVLSRYEHTRTVRPSHLLQFFLLLLLACDAIRLRTLYLAEYPVSLLAWASLHTFFTAGLLLVESTSKRRLLKGDDDKQIPPEETIGLFSEKAFWFLNGLFLTGYRKILTPKDLFTIDSELVSDDIRTSFQRDWNLLTSKGVQRPIYRVIFNTLWPDLLLPVVPRILYMGTNLAQPYLISAMVRYIQDPKFTNNANMGYGLIVSFFLNYAFAAVFYSWYMQSVTRFTVKLRGGLIALVYGKALQTPLNDVNIGSATVLMNVDVEKVVLSCKNLHEFWAVLVSSAIAVYILYTNIGAAFVAPLITILLSTLLSSYVGRHIRPRQAAWVASTEKRVTSIAYAAGNMKGIKMLGLTETVLSKLTGLRRTEIAMSKYVRRLLNWTFVISNIIFPLCAFTTYVTFAVITLYSSRELNLEVLFGSLSALKLVTTPLMLMLQAIPTFFGGIASLDRIQAYLNGGSPPESSSGSHSQEGIELHDITPARNSCEADSVISLRKVSFQFEKDKPLLHDVTLDIPLRSFTMVAGKVASGKSVLLQALIGEMTPSGGSISKKSSGIGYCAQTAWLRNLSLRQNILGETPFDADWYNYVTWACGLQRDFSELKNGDATLVGSKGISLSGGQKNRICLARALYSRKPLLIIDDMLSGLDKTTEKLVFDRVFGRGGILRRSHTTVVLATHSTHLLPEADQIIVMDSGRVAEQGTYEELLARPGFFEKYEVTSNPSALQAEQQPAVDIVGETESIKSSVLTGIHAEDPILSDIETMDQSSERRDGDLRCLLYFFAAIGLKHNFLFHIGLVSLNVAMTIQNIWLKWWAESNKTSDADVKRNIGIFSAITFICVVVAAFALSHFTLGFMPALSRKMHANQLNALMRAAYSFVVRTDIGQITNRFSQDIVLVDIPLPVAYVNFVDAGLQIITLLIITAVATPPIAAIVPFLLAACWVIQRVYLRTSRQIRLMDLEAKAPLCTHFLETLAGIATVRAFGWSNSYRERSNQLLDFSQSPFYLLAAIQNWLKLVLELMVAGIVTFIVVFSVVLKNKVDPGFLGLALTGVMDIGFMLRTIVEAWTDLETSLGAVSRIREFAHKTPLEEQESVTSAPTGWPAEGSIQFNRLVAAYSEDSSPVLKGIDLAINAGEKIGICGRTGSGKSSLVSTLFGLLHQQSGNIDIDGVPIDSVPLQELRSKIIALPQEPFFLPGTVRDNLIPWDDNIARPNVTEDDMRAALKEVQLLDKLENAAAEAGLQSVCDVSLDNVESLFSQGERQLFCLARAMLMGGKIVILDEATSSVDKDTDLLMQSIVRSVFANRTILAIAHRLETILDFDRIVVMDAGKIVEVGAPDDLLKRRDGIFRSLLEQEEMRSTEAEGP